MPSIAAGTAVVVGVAVLLGWVLDVSWLRSFVPGVTNPMVASTAVSFILTGSSLWLLRQEDVSRSRRWLGAGLALVATTIGLLKLGEYAFGWNLGIDQTLLTENAGPFPGQMAVPTAVTFVLVGLGLAGLDVETRRGGRPAQVTLLLALLFPILGLLGRLYDVPTLSSLVGGAVVMALHTSVTFMALCVGGLAARRSRGSMRIITGHGPAGLLLRRFLPSAIVMLAVAGWLRLQGQRLGLYGTEVGAALMVILTIVLLTVLVWRNARSLHAADVERREAEELRRADERRFQAVAENTPDAIVTVSSDSVITYFNRGAETMFGYEMAEVVGQQVTMLMPERYRRPHREGMARYLASGEAHVLGKTVELAGRRQDGSEFPLELSLSSWSTGEGISFIASIRDITARKEADEAIHRTREEAERANQAKSEFLSRMSHELRTPLNAILGFGQLMEMDDLGPEHRESLTQILKAGRHLVDLIEEVLDISRVEAGRLSLSLEPVAIDETVRECLELLAPSAKHRSVGLTWDAEAASGRYVMADRQRLKQVLLNLLSNAVKYNRPDGEIRVSFREQDGRVRLEVADTGPGIAPEDRERLFVPFERLGQTEAEGTGLGLALSKGLVEAMGGSIGMESQEGEGSLFWVELFEAREPMPSARESQLEKPLGSEIPDRARTVLYIEDNPINLGLVDKILARRPGMRLLSAMRGGLGLELARLHRPDLILLDVHLPDMPGEEVLRRLREDPATRHVPVVVISADAMPERVQRLLAGGARAYLTKPLDVRRLLKLVAEAGNGNAGSPS
ncbi:MAG: hybrid sensor histidine kinase/response regulator [Actinomycetota bacterium]